MNIAEYVITDSFFGTPYINAEEFREEPIPFQYVHGGFEGTDTRFRSTSRPKTSTAAGSSSTCTQVTTNERVTPP
jgi:hypothetical protein